jgi:hypothetical protein
MDATADKLIEFAPTVALGFMALGLSGYSVALILAAFFSSKPDSLGARLARWFTAHPAQNLGMPWSAISAFAITAVLMKAFPPASNTNAQLEFKVFGLEFTGPSGPITLWLMCFLGLVAALKVLRS